jgi:23S rRNA pseudouridine1911/1915/1917 synthase
VSDPDSSNHEERLVADAEEAGLRIDVFLARRLPSLSRSQIQRLIKAGHITAGDRPIKTSALVTPGLAVRVVLPAAEPADPIAESLPIEILYDDADVVVINKPAGMVVHPAPGHPRGTLVNALLHHVSGLSGIGGKERPGIVHRLDRGTSGVMVIAKHDRAHRDLSRQFRDRTVVKEYIALVWGRVATGQTLDQPIGRDPRDRRKMSSRAPRGRNAITTVLVVEVLGALSLVRLAIGTGRTHQIRVHLSEAGHAVVGDALYGGVRRRLPPALAPVTRLERPFLHAAQVEFDHPADGRRLSFRAPLPDDLADTLLALRRTRGSEPFSTDRGPEGTELPERAR